MNDTTSAERPLTKASITATHRGVTLQNMEEMWRFCTAVVNSRQIKDIETPEIALIRLQAGLELGLSPIWSLTNIMVTNGRPSVWGDGLLGLIQSRPDCEDVVESFEGAHDALTAVCEVRRKGRAPTVRKFSVEDAKLAGLWAKSGPWTSYPHRMLQMRARAWACRDAFADALRGLGVVEELEDIPGVKPAKARELRKLRLPGEDAVGFTTEITIEAERRGPSELSSNEGGRKSTDGNGVSTLARASVDNGPDRDVLANVATPASVATGAQLGSSAVSLRTIEPATVNATEVGQ
jgi:hypothetical protein